MRIRGTFDRSTSSTTLAFICLLIFLCTPLTWADDAAPSLIERTDRYEFHSNFWLNLHHYLYNLAKKPADYKLEGGRRLTKIEYENLMAAAAWYKTNLSELDLLLNRRMYGIKRALIISGAAELPAGEVLTAEHLQQLEIAAPVYRKYYWPRHDQQNRSQFAWNEERIRALENPILDRISELAEKPWPDEPIRVDLSWDANWAGAYCTTNPIHAVLTSRSGGPENTWPPGGWFELLFHEPSHALIDPNNSPVAKAINKASTERGAESPGGLWHAVLFYLSGTAVREGLASEGIDQNLLMDDGEIFSRYHPMLFKHMPAYVAGDVSLEVAMENVIGEFEEQ